MRNILLILIVFFGVYINKIYSQQQQSETSLNKTVVIVHGAWGGSWAFKGVDSVLTGEGFNVYRPSLTGLGERVHLSDCEINLSTHIKDVVNLILYEDIDDIVLIGHSYGGMVVTGVADSLAERIKHLIYVDAFIPNDHESLMDIAGDTAWLKKMTSGNFVVPFWVAPDQSPPKDVPHPINTLTEKIILNSETAKHIPGTYILTVEGGKVAEEDNFYKQSNRAKDRGYELFQLEADHNPQWSALDPFCDLLIKIISEIK